MLSGAQANSQTQKLKDPYDLDLVSLLLSAERGTPAANLSENEKYNERLGDRVSVALIKIFDQRQLIDPANVKRYLPIISDSFGGLGIISYEEDLDPKATLFLLHWLEQNLKDAALKKQVTNLKSKISKLQPAQSTGTATHSQTQTRNDPYEIDFVKTLLSIEPGSPEASIFDKYNNRLGDQISIGLIKLLDEKQLLDPATVKTYLPIISDSFVEARLISSQEDLDPKATLFLLHCLKQNLKDAELRKQVTELETRISEFQGRSPK
jgi:hypothetical protein